MNRIGTKIIIASSVGLILIALIAGGYFVFSGKSAMTDKGGFVEEELLLAGENLPRDSETGKVLVSEAIAEPAEPPAGYIEYKNERYGFSFYHSPKATVREVDEGQGAMTVVVENEEAARGFQVFILPYSETVITEKRFKMDVPSGVVNNLEETQIGKLGIPAITFNSYNQFLGETREVWFIHGGFLFEITTFKGMGDWFAPIMQTWRFL